MKFLFLLFFFFFSSQWAYSYERGEGVSDSGPVQSVDFDELETCPNPNPPATPPVQSSNTPPNVIYPMAPKTANKSQEVQEENVSAEANKVNVIYPMAPKTANKSQEVQEGNVSAEANKVLEVGYTCKVSTVETRPDSEEGYKGDGYAQWTLVKKEGKKEIWVAHTQRWGPVYVGPIEEGRVPVVTSVTGPVYVGSVEDGYYDFNEAKKICDRTEEFIFDGETYRIKMTLPEIGFGRGDSDFDSPLNFELLKYLNYTSVVSNESRRNWFWSSSFSHKNYNLAASWVFHPSGHSLIKYGLKYSGRQNNYLVRCVGR